jgi:hypothetical protein
LIAATKFASEFVSAAPTLNWLPVAPLATAVNTTPQTVTVLVAAALAVNTTLTVLDAVAAVDALPSPSWGTPQVGAAPRFVA